MGHIENRLAEFHRISMTKESLSNAKIVFQGVEGAYSHQAMLTFFGRECDGYHVETWKDAMEDIKNGKADYAVLPIENSSAGFVSENYDLLAKYDNYIVGEQTIKIDHALLGLPEAKMEDITQVYSHPQAFMQSLNYLDKRRNWEKISLKNTAVAAKKVCEDQNIHQAAIASEISADIYGLKVLDHAIQDNKNNYTRFIIVSGKTVYTKEADHISICFELSHKSGSLYQALGHFMRHHLNMTYIQSRPTGNKNWEYWFFVDFEGNFGDENVKNAIIGLEKETTALKILGSY